MAIKIGILGAGKVGIAIAALLDVMRFVDSVVLADVDSRRKIWMHCEEPAFANWTSARGRISQIS